MVLQMFYKGKEVKPRTLDKDGKKYSMQEISSWKTPK